MPIELLPLIVGIGFLVVVVAIARQGDRPPRRRTGTDSPWTPSHHGFTSSTDSAPPETYAHHTHHDSTPSADVTPSYDASPSLDASGSFDAGSSSGGGCGE